MKSLKYLLTIAAVTGALTFSAQADLQFLGATDFDSQPNNNPESNQQALGDFLGQDVSNFTLCGNFEDLNTEEDTTIDVMPGAYLVVHYGKGPDGSSKGGSLEFYRVINGETSVTVPGKGTSEFGNGGLSSIREFCPPTVPDSGTTAMLLGSALAGLGLARRYLKR
jgi:protein with PEP-CTERM/exosortase system signal